MVLVAAQIVTWGGHSLVTADFKHVSYVYDSGRSKSTLAHCFALLVISRLAGISLVFMLTLGVS